jgi:NAD-dependent SIR2 family protein deacetylase
MKRSTKTKAEFPANFDALATAIRERRLILFVGGGISQSLGLPDFRELVEHLALELGFDKDQVTVADYPVVAEAYVAKHGKLGALRSWMDTTWHPSTIDIAKSEIHNLILDLDFPIIYTTNYDRWLELAFEARGTPYHKIASIADLADFQRSGTEIIKFHGDFEDDESLVLTETNYFQRMNFESPLDIRLRGDCLARPILFIGYSLHDVNTRYLLFRLQELWKNTAYSQQRPKSFIFMVEDDPVQAIVLRSRGIEPILAQQADPKKSAITFLEELMRRVKPRMNKVRTHDSV